MAKFDEFQQKVWIEWFRKEFYRQFAYGFQDPEDVLSSIITDVLIVKMPKVELTDKSKPEGYVKTMFRNRARDYFYHYHKKHQPPIELINKGEPYPRIYYEFCLGKLPSDVIATKLKIALRKVEHWVEWLKKEQRCPVSLIAVSLDDVGESLKLSDQPCYHPMRSASSVEATYSDSYITVLVNWILGRFNKSMESNVNTVVGAEFELTGNDSIKLEQLETLFKNLLDQLDKLPTVPISAEDALLLTMLYEEELTLAEAADILKLKIHQVSYRRDQILVRLERYLKNQGIDFND